MVKETERAIQLYVEQQLYINGYRTARFNERCSRGFPDSFFIHPKFPPFFIEFKYNGNGLSTVQSRVKKILEKDGIPVFIVDETNYKQFVAEKINKI